MQNTEDMYLADASRTIKAAEVIKLPDVIDIYLVSYEDQGTSVLISSNDITVVLIAEANRGERVTVAHYELNPATLAITGLD